MPGFTERLGLYHSNRASVPDQHCINGPSPEDRYSHGRGMPRFSCVISRDNRTGTVVGSRSPSSPYLLPQAFHCPTASLGVFFGP